MIRTLYRILSNTTDEPVEVSGEVSISEVLMIMLAAGYFILNIVR